MNNDNFGTDLEGNIFVSKLASNIKQEIEHLKLAQKWQISLKKSLKTVRKTIQGGIRTVLRPPSFRLFRTNDRKLRHRQLPQYLFGDIMFSGTK